MHRRAGRSRRIVRSSGTLIFSGTHFYETTSCQSGVLSKLTRHSTERGSGLPDSKWVCGQYLKGHGVHIVLRQKTNQINVALSKMVIQSNAESIPNGPVTLRNVLSEFRFQTDPTLCGIEHWSSGNTGRVCRVFPERNKVIQLAPVGGTPLEMWPS